jgi:hypothetical protein
MGTRADFYVGRGEDAEWIGSVAWDGYPDGFRKGGILNAATEDAFRAAVTRMLGRRDDATTPDLGWPWPWEDSRTTDYAYAFDSGKVWASCFGHEWFDPTKPEPEEDTPKSAVFPDMSARKAATLGPRSGLLVLSMPKP